MLRKHDKTCGGEKCEKMAALRQMRRVPGCDGAAGVAYLRFCDRAGHRIAHPIGATNTEYDALVKLFSSIPVKHTRLKISERQQVAVGGEIFGLRLYTSGVIVVSTEPVQTADGAVFPAKKAGLKAGDIILTVDGTPVNSHTQFSALLADAQGLALQFTFLRNGEEHETTFAAAYSTVYGRYMAGLWVRDSAAGIGTMTFFLPQTGVYAGLGHAVCDVDTGEILPLYNGDIVSAELHGIKKGSPGQAGAQTGQAEASPVELVALGAALWAQAAFVAALREEAAH